MSHESRHLRDNHDMKASFGKVSTYFVKCSTFACTWAASYGNSIDGIESIFYQFLKDNCFINVGIDINSFL
jgi:hypothetical protein